MKNKNTTQIVKLNHVILTGGVGSRLWPLSRRSCPKQYLAIFKNKSLFQMTLERNTSVTGSIIVVGNTSNRTLSESILKKENKNYIDIIESTPRNTAAAIAFAAFEVHLEAILLITPSDQIIIGDNEYKSALKKAKELAEEGNIVTFGIRPTKPETGYGYIEFNDTDVISFREKPNRILAQEFLESGKFLWNSGMFCFKAGIFLEELKTLAPDIYFTSKYAYDICKTNTNNHQRFLDYELSMKIPSISVDYAVMENSNKIKVIPSDFEWSDLGSFEAIYDYLISIGHPVDENGNMLIGTEKHTSFIGLTNTIFVNTPDANLILSKENSQDVKKLYSMLEAINSPLLD